MKKYAMAACLFTAALNICAQTEEEDSLRVIDLQEVEIVSARATGTTPMTFINISRDQLKKQNFGQDLPYLLNITPSAITTSDVGAGIGYTALRVRSADGAHINITANGISVNDAGNHNVFWVNLPSFTSPVKDIQIQRDARISIDGAEVFGASINMQTGDFSPKSYVELSDSYSSPNTHEETVKMGAGLINDRWFFNARLPDISPNRCINRASVGLNSYYLQGGYCNDNTPVKLITFDGKERTYHAWNYASKEEMKGYGHRYNSYGHMYTDDDDIDHYYEDRTDNYVQKNYQLLFGHNFTSTWNVNTGLHYTKGDGYHQGYKDNRKLVECDLLLYEYDGETVEKGDLIRKKAMDNWSGGDIFSANHKDSRLHASLGGGLNRHGGDHFGKVLWVKSCTGTLGLSKDYYRNNATKNDGNLYLKTDYELYDGFNAYADLRYHHTSYKIYGQNGKRSSVTGDGLQRLAIYEELDFFNSRAGLSWQIGRNSRVYGSFSVAHKKPTRDNYMDGKFTKHPKVERLFDYKLEYTFANSWLDLGANLYYMDYKDQLVLTGEPNKIDEVVTVNVPDSYHMDVKLMAGLKLPYGSQWDVNATLSRNHVENFTEALHENEDPVDEKWNTYLSDVHIALSPNFLLNNRFGHTYKGFKASLQSQYVNKQYMSNLDCKDYILDAYLVNSLNLSCTFALPKIELMTVGYAIYNLFNEEYENNGYTGSGFYYEDGRKMRYNYTGYAA